VEPQLVPNPHPRPTPPVEAAPPRGREDQVAELEARLARDREALKALLGGSSGEGDEWLRDPELRELARRLPQLQAEIEALRREEQP
jgi:hypothetical protein